MRHVASFWGPTPVALLLLVGLTALQLLLWCGQPATAATDPIYLLRLTYTTNDEDGDTATAIWNGLDAALYAASYTTANSQTITVVTGAVGSAVSNSASVVQSALTANPTLLGLIGPFSSAGLSALTSSTVLSSNNLVCFAPFTYASSLRTWNDNLYFTRAEPEAELLLLLDYAMNTLRAVQVGFMYLTDSMIGATEYARVVSVLSAAGQNAPILYTAALDDTAALNTTAFATMANAGVQAIIVFAPPRQQTVDFVVACLTDSRTSGAILLGPSLLTALFQEQYTLLSTAGTITYADKHVLNSMTNVLPDANTLSHVQLFQTEMSNYITSSGTSSYTDSSYYTTNLTMGAAMLSGWIAGKALMQALNHLDWTASASAFQTGLFSQNRYVVGSDFVLGDYGGTCDAFAAAQGAMCECNQGGHTTFLTTLVSSKLTSAGVNYSYPLTDCYVASAAVDTPLNFVLLNFTDSTSLMAVANLLSSLTDEAATTTTSTTSSMRSSTSFSYNYATLATTTTTATAQSAIDAYLTSHTTTAIYGPYLTALDTSIMVIEPIYPKAAARVLARNVLTLRPTVEQFFYILTGNYGGLGVKAVTVVLRGYTSAQESAIKSYATRTADNFNVKTPSIKSITESANIANSLSTSGLSVLMGIVSGDATTLASFLTINTGARVFLGPQDFYVYYSELVTAFTGVATSVQDRLLFMTNLPLWTDTSASARAASQALTSYQTAAPTPYTPLAFELFVTTWFFDSLTANMATSNSTTLIDFVYSVGMIAAKDLVLGQFAWNCPNTASASCVQHNYGARSIATMSIHRVLDPTVALTLAATTPAMSYASRSKSGLSKGQLAGIIVGSVVGGLLIIGLILYFCCFSGGSSRNNNWAPQRTEDPVTIMFTDIESSTALWAALPQLMPEAVATHHRVIRGVIKKHKCYEVKTIGDSFMIACKDPFSAVKLATDIQTKLLKYDWKSGDIDEAYRHFELKRAKDPADGQAPTAALSRDVYEALWNGLRVRMGIHTGLSDIRHDEVTKGYDYYGDTSNMAARTEAIANGGQVIMTEATWWALSAEERSGLNFRKMGPQGLRGVPYAVDMYQLNPVLGRQYMPLRTEIDAYIPDMEDARSSENGADELLSSNSAMSGAATAVAYVLASCYSTYPPAQRIRELQPLLSKWSVPAPPRPQGISEEDYCQGLFNRLAVRVAHVTQVRYVQSTDGALDFNPLASTTKEMSSPVNQRKMELRDMVLNKSATQRGGNRHGSSGYNARGGLTSPLGVSAVSRLMVDTPADTRTAPPPDRQPSPRPLLSSEEGMTAFERSALGSATVHTFERSQRASTAMISMEAVQRLMHGMGPRPSQSSALTPAVPSQSENRNSYLEAVRNDPSAFS